jgi:hypothetical protein
MDKVPETGVCPNCGLGSAFASTAHFLVWPTFIAKLDNIPSSLNQRQYLTIVTCRHCSKTSTYLERRINVPSEPGGPPTWRTNVRLLLPKTSPRELSEEVPSSVRSLFREASVCEANGALRGAAGLYRAAVEALCDDQKVPAGSLAKRLDGLRAKAIDDQIVDDLHEARLLGNFSLHDGMEFSSAEVADVAELIIEATTALYVQPAERRRLRDARRERRERGGDRA